MNLGQLIGELRLRGDHDGVALHPMNSVQDVRVGTSITKRESLLLAYLRAEGHAGVKEVATGLQITPANAGFTLNNAYSKGLITRSKPPGGGRYQYRIAGHV